MKKVKYLLLAITLGLVLTACSMNKTAPNPEKFKSIVESENFTVNDITYQYEEQDYLKTVYLAVDPTKSYQIEYYVFDSNDTAKKYYNHNKDIFEEDKDSKYLTTHVDLTNSNRFEMYSDDEYKFVARIDSTMVYINTKKEYKSEIDKVIKKLGY